jgi:hypothetical protein
LTTLALTDGPASAADPTTADCLAATEASVKLGNEHRLRAQRAQLLVCAAANCPADIRKDCVSRAEDLNQQIPTVIFAAKDGSGADLSAVKITMDGEVLAERLEGTALSIDPGEHTFTFETPGQPPVTSKFMIQEAQKDRRELIKFGAVPMSEAPPPAASRGEVGVEARAAGPVSTVRRTVGWVVGGVGVAGLAAGVALLVTGSGKRGDCSNGICMTQPELNNYNSGTPLINAGTGLLIGGGILTAAGAVLWISNPGGGHVAQGSLAEGFHVAIAPNGIVLSGGF